MQTLLMYTAWKDIFHIVVIIDLRSSRQYSVFNKDSVRVLVNVYVVLCVTFLDNFTLGRIRKTSTGFNSDL